MNILATTSIVDSGESICDLEYCIYPRLEVKIEKSFCTFVRNLNTGPIHTENREKKLSNWFVPFRNVQAVEK
jgi:hypothetical protein